MSGESAEGGPGGASRGLYSQCADEGTEFLRKIPHAWGRPKNAALLRSAAADLPGRRPFRRGCGRGAEKADAAST